jgi:CHAT domain
MRRQPDSLAIADLETMLAWGWTKETLQEDILRLDYACMEGLTQLHGGTVAQWAPIFFDHPSSWRILVRGQNHMVGYWHFVALSRDDFALAMAGKLSDESLSASTVMSFEVPGDYDIYFAGLVIDPVYRTPASFTMLFGSLLDTLYSLAEDDVYIRRVCTNAFTASGVSLCRTLRMKEVVDHFDHGKIFLAPMAQLLEQKIAGMHPKLQRTYRALQVMEQPGRGRAIRLLFLSANSDYRRPLDLEDEERRVKKELRQSRYRDEITLVPGVAARTSDVVSLVREHEPAIIHFSGHGTPHGLYLREDDAPHYDVQGADLGRLLDGRGVELIVLNNCYSKHLAGDLLRAVPSVISVRREVEDKIAMNFAAALYRGLGNGLSISEAFRDATDELGLRGARDLYDLTGDGNRILVNRDT